MQRLDQERADPIEGTEGVEFPFFSSDGDWIAYFDGGFLKRVSVADGDIETIGPHSERRPWGATWGDDGTIVWSDTGGLFQVAATGGESELLAGPDALPGGLGRYAQPHMLPGSEALLFHARPSMDPETAEIVALDLATGTQKTVLTDAMDPRYVQTGHLLFMRQGTLMAVGFDLQGLEVQGQPVIMLEDVMHSIFMPNSNNDTGAAQVAVSASGHLAYALGGVLPSRRDMAVRLTNTGDTIPFEMDRREYGHFRASPEGDRLAFTIGRGLQRNIWVRDLSRGQNQRLNTGGFINGAMEWSPDGRWLAFSSDRDREGGQNIYRIAADGNGEPERLAPPTERRQTMSSWSSEGVIAWLEHDDSGVFDIWVLPPDGDAAPFFTSAEQETYATFSPDGQWLAYVSDRSERQEVYVRPYPGPGPATLISDGGVSPAWSPDGLEIYFWRAGVLWAVDVTPGDEFQGGRPAPLIDPWRYYFSPVRRYDVFPDGSFVKSVLDVGGRSPEERYGATELHVILNWAGELKGRVGN